MPGYQGKVAVVTGAASGIGFAVAARAAAEGMTVVLADIDTGKLRDAAAALRGAGAMCTPSGSIPTSPPRPAGRPPSPSCPAC